MSIVNKIKDYFSVSAVQQAVVLPNVAVAIALAFKPNNSLLEYIVIGGCAFAAAFNEALAMRQYIIMNRFENTIKEHGYDPRVAKPFMKTYCGRKIVKGVLEKNNLLDEYKSLTE